MKDRVWIVLNQPGPFDSSSPSPIGCISFDFITNNFREGKIHLSIHNEKNDFIKQCTNGNFLKVSY